MGCCATKPHVSKGDGAEEPVPIPSSRWTQDSVDEATEAKKEVEPSDLNHEAVVKPKDVHRHHHQRSLSNLFKEEEMNMLAKTDNTQEQVEASSDTEKLKKKTKMQRQSSKANHEIEHHSKPIEDNDRPELVYIAPPNIESVQSNIETKSAPQDNVIMDQEKEDRAKPIKHTYKPDFVYVPPGNVESVRSIKAKPTPEEEDVSIIMNQETEEPDENPIELIDDEPDHVIVGPGKSEPVQSTEAKSGPKVIVEEIEEPAKPIDESDPGKIESVQPIEPELAPKASTDTEKLKEVNVSTNLKTEGPKGLVDYKGDPIDGFPRDIDDKLEAEEEADTVKPTKISNK